jgi:hypothetical protein
MRELSLTLNEATAVCSDYQHLVGRALTTEPTDFSIIECVTIAPHDEVNKWIFANHYFQGEAPQEALGFYACPFYDVILLARYKSDNEKVLYIDLHSYLKQKQHLDMTIESGMPPISEP